MTQHRILLLIPELGFGGAEASLLRLGEWLVEQAGQDVTMVVFATKSAEDAYTATHRPTQLDVIALDSDAERKPGMLAWCRRWWNRWRRLARLKRDNDVCISFLTGTSLLNALTPGKSIVSLRGSRLFDPSIQGASLMLYRFFLDPLMFAMADRSVSLTQGLTYELGHYLPAFVRNKLVTIPVFVFVDEVRKRAAADIELSLQSLVDLPVILTFSRIAAEKGILDVVRVFGAVKSEVVDARLVIVGDGPELDAVTACCEKLGLTWSTGTDRVESDVILVGYQPDPVRYCRIARVFVLGSRSEGGPNSLIECLATDVQIVANDVPWGPRMVLGDDRPGVFAQAYPSRAPYAAACGTLMPRIDRLENEAMWVEVLQDKLSSTITNQELSNRQRRLNEHDASVIGRQWTALIDTVVAEGR